MLQNLSTNPKLNETQNQIHSHRPTVLGPLPHRFRADHHGHHLQGQLTSGAGNANGSFDLTFAVWDANVAGNFIAGPVTNSAVAVSNGLFTVQLDFGPGVFTGTNYWVEMGVRTNGGAGFATLVPRQQLTPAPYALYAPQASNALYAISRQRNDGQLCHPAGNASQASTAIALSGASPQINSLCPVGSVMAYMGTTAPTGWLLCDGSSVSRTTYAALFTIVGTSSGSGNGSTTFNLPDMRGVFLRGVPGARADGKGDPDANTTYRTSISGGNAGDAVGSYQADMLVNHTRNMGAVRQYHNPNRTSPWVVDGAAGVSRRTTERLRHWWKRNPSEERSRQLHHQVLKR